MTDAETKRMRHVACQSSEALKSYMKVIIAGRPRHHDDLDNVSMLWPQC
jgi:hypothetical protein